MSLLSDLTAVLSDTFEEAGLDRAYGEVAVSQRPELSQFQCNGALAAAKAAGKPPRDIAAAIVEAVGEREDIDAMSVEGPGFINISVTDDRLAHVVARAATDPRLGVPAVAAKNVVVDYGGPNVAKELHVGHVRPAVIGESIKRLLRFVGHNVTGDVHLGDWGIPMGQLICELEDRRPELPYFDPLRKGPYPAESPVTVEDLQAMYPEAAARARDDLLFSERSRRAVVELQEGRAGYRALWQHFRDVSVEAIKDVYDDLDVEFDLWHGESTINDRLGPMVRRLTESGVAVESQGALVVDVADPADKKEIPPFLLVKSDGATLYTTWDLATIEARVETLGAEEMIYVVDVRQSLHFEQVFRAARRAGIAGDGVILEHAGNGTVNGPDGKPFKTRDGGLLRLRDLIAQIVERAGTRLDENDLAAGYTEDERARIKHVVAMAALKFGDLHNHRTSNYIFDIDRFTAFEGKTGPYLLYGAVRIKSILRNAAERGLEPGVIVAPEKDQERNLMLQLARLPEVIARAAEFRAPNHIAEYAYDVVTAFNRFYEVCHILREDDPAVQSSWLGLVDLTLRQLELLLDLLGIAVPERM
jgi:arginyl-tRNA synthetase